MHVSCNIVLFVCLLFVSLCVLLYALHVLSVLYFMSSMSLTAWNKNNE